MSADPNVRLSGGSRAVKIRVRIKESEWPNNGEKAKTDSGEFTAVPLNMEQVCA